MILKIVLMIRKTSYCDDWVELSGHSGFQKKVFFIVNVWFIGLKCAIWYVLYIIYNIMTVLSDMQNVPSKPSAAQVILFWLG